MKPVRIHVLGASGSGTSTLGRELAVRLALPHVESDDIFWEKTDPPFTTRRAAAPREEILREKTLAASWIFSGSAIPWGDFLRTRHTLVIFLSMPQDLRLQRLRMREAKRYGARVAPGGDMHAAHEAFIDWAALYEKGDINVRSRALHESWLRSIPSPVLRIDANIPTAEQSELVAEFLQQKLEFAVEKMKGPEAAPLVDPFYESLNRSARARPEDVFFLAKRGKKLLGCVRYCVEEEIALLRGMLVHETARKQGVGQKLLESFDTHLKEIGAGPVFCLPHAHLEGFYGTIGFRKCAEAPAFLEARAKQYLQDGMTDVILMRRN